MRAGSGKAGSSGYESPAAAEGTRLESRAWQGTSDFLLYSRAGYLHGCGRSSGLPFFMRQREPPRPQPHSIGEDHG